MSAEYIGALLDSHAARIPDKPFLDCDGTATTWRQFCERRDGYARFLLTEGIASGDRVAVQCDLSSNLLFLLFGIWRIGAIAVMSNTANTLREFEQAIDLASACFAIVDELPEGQPGNDATVTVRRLSEVDAVVALSEQESELPAGPGSNDRATMLFTSGSTAAPKCVVLHHRHHLLAGRVVTRMLDLSGDDSFLQFFPVFHMNGLGHLAGAITAASTVILHARYRTSEFREWVRDQRPTVAAINATHIKMLANDHLRLASGESKLRAVQLGLSAVLPDELYDSFENEFGCVLVESYGLTESATLCSTSTPTDRRRRSCGKPIAECGIRIVDDARSATANGRLGAVEICLREHGPLPGYLGMEAPSGDEWVQTGDVGYFDEDGFFFWVDRHKELIKRAGENIAPSEVELVLESHPAVTEAVVVGVADELREEVPWAWVVTESGSSVTGAELLDHCRGRLAKFKIPEGVDFVEAFPRTGVGKIERKSVREWTPSRP